jgi:hypothetical protein
MDITTSTVSCELKSARRLATNTSFGVKNHHIGFNIDAHDPVGLMNEITGGHLQSTFDAASIDRYHLRVK